MLSSTILSLPTPHLPPIPRHHTNYLRWLSRSSAFMCTPIPSPGPLRQPQERSIIPVSQGSVFCVLGLMVGSDLFELGYNISNLICSYSAGASVIQTSTTTAPKLFGCMTIMTSINATCHSVVVSRFMRLMRSDSGSPMVCQSLKIYEAAGSCVCVSIIGVSTIFIWRPLLSRLLKHSHWGTCVLLTVCT